MSDLILSWFKTDKRKVDVRSLLEMWRYGKKKLCKIKRKHLGMWLLNLWTPVHSIHKIQIKPFGYKFYWNILIYSIYKLNLYVQISIYIWKQCIKLIWQQNYCKKKLLTWLFDIFINLHIIVIWTKNHECEKEILTKFKGHCYQTIIIIVIYCWDPLLTS